MRFSFHLNAWKEIVVIFFKNIIGPCFQSLVGNTYGNA